MADIKIYRIYDESSMAKRRLLSIVTDGKNTSFVYRDRMEKSSNPDGLMKQLLDRSETKPSTALEWLALVQRSMSMTSVESVESKGTLRAIARQELKSAEESEAESPAERAEQIRQRELSDSIDMLMIENPDLSEFLDPAGNVQEEPESMRDYIRLVLQSQGALGLNPELEDWLNGGEAPEDFGGLVFFPETVTSSDKESK